MKKKILFCTISFLLLLFIIKAPTKEVEAATSYTLTLEGRGGTINGSKRSTISVTAGGNIYNTIKSFHVSKSGTTFQGWYYDEDGTNPLKTTDTMTHAITLYARYSNDVKRYTITMNSNGGRNYNGTTVTTITVAENTKIMSVISTLNPANRTGYTFLGWFYDQNLKNAVTNSQTLTSNITIYAGWAEISYSLTWNPNGGYFR